MKKIGLVTFHRSNSYGACLQAFATIEFLKDNGYDAEIIDYTNSYEQRFQKLFYSEDGSLSGYVKSLIKDIFLRKRHYSRMAFGQWEKIYPLSKQRYHSKEELRNVSYDALIVGSDQVWNREITKESDDVFLLQFGKTEKRISVASSMGSSILNEEEKVLFKNALETFTSISIREEQGKKQLKPLTDKPIKVLMDPTFFLTGTEWFTKLGSKSQYKDKKEKYILTFFVAPNNTYKEKVQGYADLLNLPVWSIQSTKIKRVNSARCILGATIDDFIALISNAELVITDSFHGAALSLNLGKNFVSIKNVGNPIRVVALLNELGISERLDMKPEDYRDVDYVSVGKELDVLCDDSKRWVISALEN